MAGAKRRRGSHLVIAQFLLHPRKIAGLHKSPLLVCSRFVLGPNSYSEPAGTSRVQLGRRRAPTSTRYSQFTERATNARRIPQLKDMFLTDATSPSLLTTLRPDVAPGPTIFETGDCGIIIRPDGSHRIVTSGVDRDGIAAWIKAGANPDELTEEQATQMDMGRKLLAISLALTHDSVMNVLLSLTANPEILDPQKLAHVSNPH